MGQHDKASCWTWLMKEGDMGYSTTPDDGGRHGDQWSQSTNSLLWLQWLLIVALVYLLMISVGVLSQGFRAVSGGSDGAAAIFEFANNPLVAVILGVFGNSFGSVFERGDFSDRGPGGRRLAHCHCDPHDHGLQHGHNRNQYFGGTW
jgi:hypothetical protein